VSNDELPDGWTRVKFGAIAASITERVDDPSASGVDRYVGLEHLDPDSTTIQRWGSPSDVEATKLRFYPGDVIYGRRRAYQRKLGVADFDGICSAHALVLRARRDVCLPEFLPYFLQSDAFHQRALDISVGSLSPTINWKTLAVQEFALPPIDEQQRIVEVIAAVDKHISCLTKQIDVACIARSAVLSELLSAGGEDWTETTLGDIATLYMGRTPSRNSSEYWTTELKYPFCTIADMEGASISPSREGVTERAIHDGKARVAPAGSLLMSFKLTIGRVGFAERDLYPNEAIVVINPDEKKATRKFLYYQLGSMDLTGNSGKAVKGSTLNSSSLARITVYLPPISEQSWIVEIMNSMDEVIQSAENAVIATKILRSSLLTLLLAGGEL